MSDDRRVHPRFDLLAQVRVRHGTVDHVLEILNISRGGALIDLARIRRPRAGWSSGGRWRSGCSTRTGVR